jgi:hypothetical protein
MIDKDQQLLWEAYVAEKKADKDYDGDGEVESAEDEYEGSKDKAIKKAMKEESAEFTDEQKARGKKSQFKQMKDDLDEEESEEKDVQEEMDNLEFSAAGRENPEQMVFDAVLSWMRADTEGLMTPEDYEGYNMSDAFDDAKEFIRDALQDISFSEIRSQLTGKMSLDDPSEAAFEASVDSDIRRDDSRLSDMPPREAGI